eukprot:CAMPEP_0197854254 /NCGR_PEP_ID=MMETSP1438-20131217/24333_1 /TAXON_ID=1461541 /ORGANISM="Pterosperma sp., Strain CCMP1384" /LENGTH=834 /DNA_ID=CAMNT_0043468927 /DNA_START=69 /DNA_END=2573 /DNA_ORIENTATION=-
MTTRNDLVIFIRLELRVLLTFLHLGYVFLSWNAIEIVDCKLDQAEDQQGVERYYLTADPSIECWTFKGTWGTLFPFAVIALLAYPVGIYLMFGLLLYSARGRTDEPAAKNILGFLYARYQKDWYWFELVVLARKSIVVCSSVIFYSVNYQNTMRQTILMMGVLLASLLFQFHAQPYDNRLLDQMECVSVASQFLMLFSGLIFLTDDDDVNEGSAILTKTFKDFLSVFIVIMLIFSYLFFGIHVLLDIFPDFKTTVNALRTRVRERRRNKAEKRRRKTNQSLVSTLKANQFADIMRLSLAAHRNMTATGKRYALAYRAKNGIEHHNERMKLLRAVEESKEEHLKVWLARKDVMPMQEVLQSHMVLGLLEGMGRRSREENEQVLAFVQTIMGMQKGTRIPAGFVPSRQDSSSNMSSTGGGGGMFEGLMKNITTAPSSTRSSFNLNITGSITGFNNNLGNDNDATSVSDLRVSSSSDLNSHPPEDTIVDLEGAEGALEDRVMDLRQQLQPSKAPEGDVHAPYNTPFSSMQIPMDVIQMVQKESEKDGVAPIRTPQRTPPQRSPLTSRDQTPDTTTRYSTSDSNSINIQMASHLMAALEGSEASSSVPSTSYSQQPHVTLGGRHGFPEAYDTSRPDTSYTEYGSNAVQSLSHRGEGAGEGSHVGSQSMRVMDEEVSLGSSAKLKPLAATWADIQAQLKAQREEIEFGASGSNAMGGSLQRAAMNQPVNNSSRHPRGTVNHQSHAGNNQARRFPDVSTSQSARSSSEVSRFPDVSVNKLGSRPPDVKMTTLLPTGSIFPAVFPGDFSKSGRMSMPTSQSGSSSREPEFGRLESIETVQL